MSHWHNRTIAQVQAHACKEDRETWSLDNHLAWYHHCVKVGRVARSFGKATASVSRNKREGKYIHHQGWQRVHAMGRALITGKPHVTVRTGGTKKS